MKHSPQRQAYIPRFNNINSLVLNYCNKKDYLKYIDINPAMYKSDQKTLDGSIFQSDSLHMNRKGYERWISIIKPILEADYKSR
jgi:lysophospholipase L1-like esterase